MYTFIYVNKQTYIHLYIRVYENSYVYTCIYVNKQTYPTHALNIIILFYIHILTQLYVPGKDGKVENISWDLPDSFFEITLNDIRSQQQILNKNAEREMTMRTQAMRDAEKPAQKDYRYTSIRVKFCNKGIYMRARIHAIHTYIHTYIQNALCIQNKLHTICTW